MVECWQSRKSASRWNCFQIIDLRAQNYMHSKKNTFTNTPPALESRVTSHMTLRLSFSSASSFLIGTPWITELLTKSPTTKSPLQHQQFQHFWIIQKRNLQYRQNASRNLRYQEREFALRNENLEGTMLIGEQFIEICRRKDASCTLSLIPKIPRMIRETWREHPWERLEIGRVLWWRLMEIQLHA